MVSYYPRTKIVYLNGMVEYQKVLSQSNNNTSADYISTEYANAIARKLINAMNDVLNTNNILDAKEYEVISSKFIPLMNIQK